MPAWRVKLQTGDCQRSGQDCPVDPGCFRDHSVCEQVLTGWSVSRKPSGQFTRALRCPVSTWAARSCQGPLRAPGVHACVETVCQPHCVSHSAVRPSPPKCRAPVDAGPIHPAPRSIFLHRALWQGSCLDAHAIWLSSLQSPCQPHTASWSERDHEPSLWVLVLKVSCDTEGGREHHTHAQCPVELLEVPPSLHTCAREWHCNVLFF